MMKCIESKRAQQPAVWVTAESNLTHHSKVHTIRHDYASVHKKVTQSHCRLESTNSSRLLTHLKPPPVRSRSSWGQLTESREEAAHHWTTLQTYLNQTLPVNCFNFLNYCIWTAQHLFTFNFCNFILTTTQPLNSCISESKTLSSHNPLDSIVSQV